MEEKTKKYTLYVFSQLSEMLSDENCNYYVSLQELQDNENLKCFIYALSCASAMLFNRMTGGEKTWLEFNHIANSLCFEFMNKSNN
jgi:hypothetical protein